MKKSSAKMKLKARSLPLMVGILLLFQLFIPYDGWKILIVGLGGAWLLSFLWARSLVKSLRISRELLYDWTNVGEWYLERFILYNRGWFPALWVTVLDQSKGLAENKNRVLGVKPRSFKAWLNRGYFISRGLYNFGPTSLLTGDPFGIYGIELIFSDSITKLVLPPIVELPRIDIATGEQVGEGRSYTKTLQRSVSSASIREYVPGDNLRWIHWGQSARRDGLFVRKFDSTHSSDWWIILDMHREVQGGEGENSTVENGVALAASLTNKGRLLGSSVGLVTHGKHLTWLPPKPGYSQNREIMHALALVQPGEHSLTDLLARTKPSLRQRTSVILITPSLDGNWIKALPSFKQWGHRLTVFLLYPTPNGSRSKPSSTTSTLLRWGVTYHIVTPDFLTLPDKRRPWNNYPESVLSLYREPTSLLPLNSLNWMKLVDLK